jgi:uncharacterized repeat protein (TIGR01451 family)
MSTACSFVAITPRQRNRGRRPAGIGARLLRLGAALGAVTTVVVAGPLAVARANVLFNETFTHPTVSVPGLSVGSTTAGGVFKQACLTASTNTTQTPIPGCTAGQAAIPAGGDPNGSGALRLTDNENDVAGYVVYNVSLPLTEGLNITFDYYSYDTRAIPADGLSFFLVNGNTTLTQPGGLGGSLSYAQYNVPPTSHAGVANGYLGVGLDEFGNFTNDAEDRGNGCSNKSPYTGLHPNYVGVRGPGNGFSGYCLLAAAPSPGPLAVGSATTRTAAGVKQVVNIVVDPPGGTNPQVTVTINGTQVLQVPEPANPPATFKFGLGASTGGDDDVHEIQNVAIDTIDPLPDLTVTKTVDGTAVAGQPLSYALQGQVGSAGGPEDQPVTITDTLPSGDTVLSTPTGSGWDCSATVPGSALVSCTYTPSSSLAPGTTLPAVTVPTLISPTATGPQTNTAVIDSTDNGNTPSQSTATATVTPVQLPPSVSIAKQALVTPAADQTAVKVGDQVAYSYLVTNTGQSNLASVAVNDPSAGPVTCPVLNSPGLAPGAAETCTGNSAHVVTQADVDTGNVVDTATATGTNYGGQVSPTSAPVTVTVPAVAARPSLQLQKTAAASLGDSAAIKVGETIQYSYVVTNTGNVNINPVSLSDPAAGPVTCPALPVAGLAPGAAVTCRANSPYTVTQADVDNGGVTDTATASGSTPSGGTVSSPPAQAQVPSVPNPQVAIQKIAAVSPAADQPAAKAGDTIDYSYKVTNTGNVTLRSVSVSDPAAGTVNCPTPAAPGLAPGAAETCAAATPYTVTQADVDAGMVVDTATATGTDTQGTSSPRSDPSTVTVPTVAPVIMTAVVKQATVSPAPDQNAVDVGDTIAYSYKVTNTGNVDLQSVSVTDATMGPVTCPTPAAPGLAPGSSLTCTAAQPYTVTQANVDAGKVLDSATATGTGPSGGVGPPSAPSTVTTPTVPPAPSVQVAKHAAVAPAADQAGYKLGDRADYTYVVTNTGDTTLATVAVLDPSIPTGVTCPPPAAPGLAPGASETCVANAPVLVTQADVDAGSLTDTATATGVDVDGNDAPTSAPSTVTVNAAAANPSISITKIANAQAGDLTTPLVGGSTIQYSYQVSNTGNVTLGSVGVDDPLLTPTAATCPQTTLAPGQTMICKAQNPYTLPATPPANLFDTATASGTPPTGAAVTAQGSVTLPATAAAPALAVQKTGTVDPSADQNDLQVGDQIHYSYQVTNTGNVNLTTVSVIDSDGLTVSCPALPSGGLAPGDAIACTAGPYTVTQADVDAGKVTDTATASGTGSVGGAAPPVKSTATSYSEPDPAVVLRKIATVSPASDQSAVKAADTIAYTYVVKNIGNVTLPTITVNDPHLPSGVTCSTPAAGLAPQASETCSANHSYTVTQADVDAGKVLDTATATGTDMLGTVSPPATSFTTVPTVPAAATISIQKVATVSPSADQNSIKVGDEVSYSYVVTNTGDVTINGVTVDDPQNGPVSCPPPAPLAPGASVTCTAKDQYRVTQADVDAGHLTDRATAQALATPYPPPPLAHGTATVPSSPAPSVSVVKTAGVDPAKDQQGVKAGDLITYSFTVTNTGNVDLSSVAVSDPSLGAVDCPRPAPPGLAPGASQTCRGEVDHRVTAKDVTKGKVLNTATATGTTATGQTSGPSQPSTTTVPAKTSARLTIRKAVNDHTAYPGQKLTYTLVVTNHGPATATRVIVTDSPRPKLKVLSVKTAHGKCTRQPLRCSLGTIADRKTVKITVVAVAERVGTEHNTAKVSSQQPNPDLSGAASSASTKVTAQLTVGKTASTDRIKTGQNDTFTITVRNPTTVTVRQITTCDRLPTDLVLSGSRQPLASDQVCWHLAALSAGATKRYQVVANAGPSAHGRLLNVAAVTAKNIQTVRGTAAVTVIPNTDAQLTIRKLVNHSTANPGQQLTYTLIVTNHGPATATGVVVSDSPSPKLRVVSVTSSHGMCARQPLRCSLGTIAVGETVKITVVAIAQRVGTEHNTAKVTAQQSNPDPSGAISSASTSVTSPLTIPGRLTVTKTASIDRVKTGENVTFTITVHNPGTVAVRQITTCDRLPTDLVLTSSQPPLAPEQICWQLAALSAGGTTRYQVVANAGPGAHGQLINVATVSANGIPTARATAAVTVIPAHRVPCAKTSAVTGTGGQPPGRGPIATAAC